MILVTTGSSGGAFDRLLSVINRFDVEEEIVVQHGPSTLRPEAATCVAYLPFDELSRIVSEARVVVSHAGVGSILLCSLLGHRPVVVPRLARFHEAVDDHQLVLARKLGELGAVTVVEDPAELPAVVRRGTRSKQRSHRAAGPNELVEELRRFLDAHGDR